MIIDGHVHPTLTVDPGWARALAPIGKIIQEMHDPYELEDSFHQIDMALCQPAAWETIYHAETASHSFNEQHAYILDCVRRHVIE